jgi:hypothetical protein
MIHGSVADIVVRGATVPLFVCRPERAGAASMDSEGGSVTVAIAERAAASGRVKGTTPRAAA